MKYVLLLFIFILNLQADAIKNEPIKGVFISEDNIKYQELNSSYSDNFNKYIKVILDKKVLEKNINYLRLHCVLDQFLYANSPHEIKNGDIFIKLDKDTPQELIFGFEESSSLVYAYLISDFEYEYLLENEKLLYGIAYGILICAFLYNLVFFFYNKYRSFLYYSLLQLCILFMLLITAFPSKLFIPLFEYTNIYDVSLSLIIIFSILFNVEFLNTKKYLPLVHKLLHVFLALYIIDLVLIFIYRNSILEEYLFVSYIFGILLLSSIVIFFKGYKPAIFYILGWIIIFLVALFSEFSYINLNATYLGHIGLPIESLLFSLALGYKVKQIEINRQKNEQLLIHQNKLATTGEMINNIAHQWRQPLTHIGYIFLNINNALKHNKLDENYLSKKTDLANKQLNYMSDTINDFRDFYSTKKAQSTFLAKDMISKAISITSATLEESNIEISTKGEDFKIKGNNNELAQIILNIIANAKDVMIERKIQNPSITIELYKSQIKIQDNAGGIDEKTKERIFEPYFTTKEKGTGIGLYMSKVIIETHFNGNLSHKNTKNGSIFTISLQNLNS